MKGAIDETLRRRKIQEDYNKAHNITPKGIQKAVKDITERVKAAAVAEKRAEYAVNAPASREEMLRLVKDLEVQMKQAAKALEFEKAALIRDRILELRKEMVIEDGQQFVKSRRSADGAKK
jgi:excinuclease ABC subunit B